jgi:hypothetical protein
MENQDGLMIQSKLQEAGFSPEEIQEYLVQEHSKLKAAGFSDAEVDMHLGPTSVSAPEPPHFDWMKHMDTKPGNSEPLPGEPDAQAKYMGLQETMYENGMRPWLAVGLNTAASCNRA